MNSRYYLININNYLSIKGYFGKVHDLKGGMLS